MSDNVGTDISQYTDGIDMSPVAVATRQAEHAKNKAAAMEKDVQNIRSIDANYDGIISKEELAHYINKGLVAKPVLEYPRALSDMCSPLDNPAKMQGMANDIYMQTLLKASGAKLEKGTFELSIADVCETHEYKASPPPTPSTSTQPPSARR